MNLRKEQDGWYLAFEKGFLQLIQIDFRLGLTFSDTPDTAKIFIENSCRLRRMNCEIKITPSEPSSLAPILTLFNAKIVGITVKVTGQLKVEFDSDLYLEIDADENYEAWEIGGSSGFLLVCSPGGRVSYFEQANKI